MEARSAVPGGRSVKVRAAFSPAYSLYLDLVRCIAALAVFLDHLTSCPFTCDTRGERHFLLALLGGYGNAAVIIFFVLSGYVIAYVVSTRERTAGEYAVNRFSRLYSVVLPALLLTLIFDSLGQWLYPQFYANRTVLWVPPTWDGYLASLLFVNEFQTLHLNGLVPGSNAPFWSLSFEATYYVLAGLALFAPRRYALPLALVLLGLAGRTIAALLPLWALGFFLYQARARLCQRLPLPWLMLLLSSAGLVALPRLTPLASFNDFGVNFPWGHGPYDRNLLLDYAVALAFAVQLIAAQRLLGTVRHLPARLERLIRWLGSSTFPMYAMHYPALCLFAALNPFARSSWLGILFVSSAVISVIALLTPVCEWLKDAIRRSLSRTPASRATRVAMR